MAGTPEQRAAVLAAMEADPGVTQRAIADLLGVNTCLASKIRAAVAAEHDLPINPEGGRSTIREAVAALLEADPDLDQHQLAARLGCNEATAGQYRRVILAERGLLAAPIVATQPAGFTAMVAEARKRARAMVAAGDDPSAAVHQVNREMPEARLSVADLGTWADT